MAKIKNPSNKKRYDRYKQENRRAINKKKKAMKHEKRMARFAKRREDGKTYQYEPNPYKKDTKEYYEEERRRLNKNNNKKKTDTQKLDSVYGKLSNYLSDKEKKRKAAEKNAVLSK